VVGQHIQLAIAFYLLINISVVYFWWFYKYEIVLILEWGDEATALMSQNFIRVSIWSYLLRGISTCLWQLLEVSDHSLEGSIMSIAWGATNVICIALLVTTQEATLQQVGLVYLGTAVFFIGLTLLVAKCRGWLDPFVKGLLQSIAFTNMSVVKLMLKQAIPLGFGSLLSNAEWAVLTVRIHIMIA
jgi:Na+-driven multidrug efflux pump